MPDIIAKIKIGPRDILFGRGSAINNHQGNINFRVVCDTNKKYFITLGNKGKAKYNYCMNILQDIKSNGGRFVQFDKAANSWYEVDDDKARMRIDRHFREPHASKTVEYSPPPIVTTTIKRSTGITSIVPNHVLFGNGKRIDTNKGNVRFRDYCTSMSGGYASLHTKEKTQLTYQMLQHLDSMGFVFLSLNKQFEPGPIRAKIAKRLRLSVHYDKGEGKLSSCVLKGFLMERSQDNVQQYITNVFDNMLNHPSKQPTKPGMEGINASVDIGPYNQNNRNVNIDRQNTYTRNEFGKSSRHGQHRDGRATLFLPAYGTGTGAITHGTSVW